MQCLFIINPSSGTKTVQKKLDHLIGKLILKQIVNHVDVFYTQQKDDAKYKCLSLSNNQYDFIVAVGGDGTINEVISGLVEKQLNIPLAILPGGTVNDFASYLKLPTKPKDFIKMIQNMKTIQVDIGQANEHYFANVVAGGMFSDIAFQVTKSEKEKFGPFAYYFSGLKQLPSQLSTEMHLTITADDHVFEEEARLFMVTNTSQVGGFKDITPLANVQDGKLDLLIIRKCSPAQLVSLLKDYTFSSHETNDIIEYVQAKNIKIESDQNIVYDVDGEEGHALPLNISIAKHSLHLIIP